jgi:hypothetical protein
MNLKIFIINIKSIKIMFENWFGMGLNDRMTKYLSKFNDDKFHPYKPHVVSLKSKQILRYLSKPTTFQEKQDQIDNYYQKVLEVVKKCYHQFDPTLIYIMNDEFHFVFYYNDEGDFRYDGNIMKLNSSITSFVSIEMAKIYGNEFDFYYQSKVVEFNDDDEVLNYIIWRQLNCKNTNLQNFYKSIHPDLDITGISLDEIESELMDNHIELTSFSNIYGVLIKKMSNGNFYTSSFNLTSDFNSIFSTFFEKKILCIEHKHEKF